MSETIGIRIHRFDPETDSEGRLVAYRIDKSPSMRVLSAISGLNAMGANIAIRYYCEEFHCGSCAVRINGVPKLACKTEVVDGMVIEPLPDFPLIKDLLVDRSGHQAQHRALDRVPEAPTGSGLDFDSATRLWKSVICIRCGICLASCPVLHCRGGAYSYIGPEFMLSLFRSEFDPRIEKSSMARATKMGLWECTLCGHCEENCPQSIPIPELILKLREKTTAEKGDLVPSSIRELNERLSKTHNPFGREEKERMAWSSGLTLPHGASDETVLYFVGCDQRFNPRDQVVARAMIEVFKKSSVECTTLGVEEVNAGDPAFVTGNRPLFATLAAINIENFKAHGGNRIVASSPHDYSLIKNEYPSLGGAFPVAHYTQFLEEMILSGRLKLKNRIEKTVAFHDPCFLGRYNDIYDSPRNVLKAIPGLTLVEISPNREQAECCGGGGGGNWLDLPAAGERVSERRLRQAMETGADIIAVACPYCLLMFEAAIKALGLEGQIEIRQVIELICQAI